MPNPTRRAALPLAALLVLGSCTLDGQDLTAPEHERGEETAAPQEPSRFDTAGSSFDRIPELVKEVAPSTVSIVTQLEQNGRVGQGVGSGVIWDADGVIVTNRHVVAQASGIEVVLANGERFPARVLASDARTDLAALRIDAEDLPAARIAEALPDVGELAVAIGNPLGLENTATAGIVSGVDRSLPLGQGGPALVGLIQTDASISSGNSGGALVNGAGEIIGINVAALGNVPAGVAENVGFAIPTTTVRPVVEQLVSDGEVAHPFLGIGGATLTPQLADRFGVQADRGVLIRQIFPDSPAQQAGVQGGDVITALDGETIASLGDLLGTLRRHRPGDTVEMTLMRSGEEQTLEITLGELPDQQDGVPPTP